MRSPDASHLTSCHLRFGRGCLYPPIRRSFGFWKLQSSRSAHRFGRSVEETSERRVSFLSSPLSTLKRKHGTTDSFFGEFSCSWNTSTSVSWTDVVCARWNSSDGASGKRERALALGWCVGHVFCRPRKASRRLDRIWSLSASYSPLGRGDSPIESLRQE